MKVASIAGGGYLATYLAGRRSHALSDYLLHSLYLVSVKRTMSGG